MSKVYVGVSADFDSLGKLTPKAIIWRNGARYEIDRIREVRREGAASRFTVEIGKRQRFLYYERSASLQRWYVDAIPAKHCCADLKALAE